MFLSLICSFVLIDYYLNTVNILYIGFLSQFFFSNINFKVRLSKFLNKSFSRVFWMKKRKTKFKIKITFKYSTWVNEQHPAYTRFFLFKLNIKTQYKLNQNECLKTLYSTWNEFLFVAKFATISNIGNWDKLIAW